MSQKQPLTRDGYLNRAVVKVVPLDDGNCVCIRALPASMIVHGAEDAKETFSAANMLVNSLCDEDGALLFAEGEKDLVMRVDHVALKKILDAIAEMNALKPAGDGEAGVAEKN